MSLVSECRRIKFIHWSEFLIKNSDSSLKIWSIASYYLRFLPQFNNNLYFFFRHLVMLRSLMMSLFKLGYIYRSFMIDLIIHKIFGVYMKIFIIILIAVIASSSSFFVHVITVEWLPNWVAAQMQNTQIQTSWSVRYIALLTSLEYGFSTIILYYLVREKLITFGRFKAFILFSMILVAINGALIRQPLMDYIIGNPLKIVLVQNIFKWLVWIIMSFIVVYGFEILIKNDKYDDQMKGI